MTSQKCGILMVKHISYIHEMMLSIDNLNTVSTVSIGTVNPDKSVLILIRLLGLAVLAV